MFLIWILIFKLTNLDRINWQNFFDSISVKIKRIKIKSSKIQIEWKKDISYSIDSSENPLKSPWKSSKNYEKLNIQIFFFTWLLMDSKHHFSFVFLRKISLLTFCFYQDFYDLFRVYSAENEIILNENNFLISDDGSAPLIILFVLKTRKICKWKSIKSINFHSSSIYKTIQLSFVFYRQWLKVKNRQIALVF